MSMLDIDHPLTTHEKRLLEHFPPLTVPKGQCRAIKEAEGDRLLAIMSQMNLLHMNDVTRAMLRDKYPATYERLVEAQYAEAERRLLRLLAGG